MSDKNYRPEGSIRVPSVINASFQLPFLKRKKKETYGSVRPLLSAVLPRPAPHGRGGRAALLRGRRGQGGLIGGRLHVDRVDDVEELLHHGDLLVDEVHLAVVGLEGIRKKKLKPVVA